MGLQHVPITIQRTSPEKYTQTLVELQQQPCKEKIESNDETYCLKRATCSGRREVCVNYPTDTDNFQIVVYPHRNPIYLKDWELELILTQYEKLIPKRVRPMSYIGVFFKQGIILDEKIAHKYITNFLKNGWFFLISILVFAKTNF